MDMSSTRLARNSFEEKALTYYDTKRSDPLNLDLGHADGFYHHHFAIDDFDRSILDDTDRDSRERRVRAEIHRLETDQVSTFVEALGELPATARILDAGCGRGGTSLLLHQACGCAVDGVNFSAYQVRFARAQAEQRGVADRVRFHEANMVATPFAAETFDCVISNETTMYVKLPEAFAEFTRVLKPGGTYVLTTWCVNDPFGISPPEAAAIDRHYMSITHRRSEYLAALTGAGLFPYQMDDFTSRALPYWELRVESALASGVEQSYLTGYRTNQVNYMRICSRKALRQQGQGVA